MKLKKITKYVVRFIICVIISASIAVMSVSAKNGETYNQMPYSSYTYWQGYSQKTAVQMKAVYEVSSVLDGGGICGEDFSNVRDICFDQNGSLYILDNVKMIIYVLDKDYRLLRKIIPKLNGEIFDFSGAGGFFVNAQGKIYIADTGHNRIIICGYNGNVEKIMERPVSNILPEDVVFQPKSVIEDSQGYIYVLSEGCFYGAMKFSADYEFLGFYGANTVETSVLSALENLVDNIFSTETKKMNDIQKIPYTFLDFCLDSEGFIFTTTSSSSKKAGQIRRLSSGGSNILTHRFNYDTTSGDNFNFGDISGITNESNNTVTNSFSAIAADDAFFYALDSSTGRIFVYDFNCNLITVFSGGFGNGEQSGVFKTATGIAVGENGDILVTDSEKMTVTVFSVTEYGELVKAASRLTLEGKFLEAETYWKHVNEQDKNNQLSYIGIAKAALMKNDYDTAISFAKAGLDRETYAKAYGDVVNNFLKEHFIWLFFGIILIFGGITVLIIVTQKKQLVFIKNRKLRTACQTLLHPSDTFNRVKDKNEGSVIIASVILLLFFVGKTCETLYAGFMYKITDTDSYNVIYTFIGTVVLMLLWTVANWATGVLIEGKGRIKQIYICSCYSLLPMIIYSIVFIIVSYFMTPSEVSFLGAFQTICIIYFIITMLISVMNVQEFDFVKAIENSLLSILGMAVVGFMIFMTLTLCQDFIGFIASIYQEVVLR